MGTVPKNAQGTKVLIVDFTGKVHGRGYHAHRFVEGLKPGEREQNPEDWVKALEIALVKALKDAKIDASKIISLGVSGQQHGFVPLDAKGVPIRPAKLWNDTSTVKETDLIIQKFGGKKSFIHKLGISPAVGYTASKILWLKRNEPENYKKLSAVLLPHNYINFFLTGKIHMEYGDASGTGLMDIRKRAWSAEAIDVIDPALGTRLPFIDGERVPVLPYSSGVLFGLNRNNFNAFHIARSIMEGPILNLGYGFIRMRSLGLRPKEIRATGGGAKSKLWLQIVANILKTPLVTLKEEEAAALGAAIQSMWNYRNFKGEKIQIEDIADEIIKINPKVIEPDPSNFPIYERLQKRFNNLWKTLKSEFKAHRKTYK